MSEPKSWFDRLCAALEVTCPRGRAACTQDFVVEFTGTWPGNGRCKACGRQFDVREAGFKDTGRAVVGSAGSAEMPPP